MYDKSPSNRNFHLHPTSHLIMNFKLSLDLYFNSKFKFNVVCWFCCCMSASVLCIVTSTPDLAHELDFWWPSSIWIRMFTWAWTIYLYRHMSMHMRISILHHYFMTWSSHATFNIKCVHSLKLVIKQYQHSNYIANTHCIRLWMCICISICCESAYLYLYSVFLCVPAMYICVCNVYCCFHVLCLHIHFHSNIHFLFCFLLSRFTCNVNSHLN